MSRSTINYFVKYQFVGYSISTNFYKRQDSAYIYICVTRGTGISQCELRLYWFSNRIVKFEEKKHVNHTLSMGACRRMGDKSKLRPHWNIFFVVLWGAFFLLFSLYGWPISLCGAFWQVFPPYISLVSVWEPFLVFFSMWGQFGPYWGAFIWSCPLPTKLSATPMSLFYSLPLVKHALILILNFMLHGVT